jgi:hypothetical protein
MKLALGLCLLSAGALVVLYGILMGVMVSGWKRSTGDMWNVAAAQTLDTMMEVVNATLDFVEFAASSVSQFDPSIGTQPAYLLRSFAAFNERSGYRMGSFGFLAHANASRPATAKVSWQVASGYGCPTYMYAYSDDAIHPAFYGYCGDANGTVDFSRRAYEGVDWGLKPQEQALLNGTLKSTYLPVFDLLGAFTLTHETIVEPAVGTAPVVTFAELDLTRLSNHIANQIMLLGGKGMAYIYETATGLLIASNTAFGTVNGTRFNVTQMTLDSAWIVTRTRHVRQGLDWTVAVGVQWGDIYGGMEHAIVVASCSGLAVLAALVAILWITTNCCVTRQLEAKRKGESAIPYSAFDEVK